MTDRHLSARVERTWAADATAFVDVLRQQDPTWRSEWSTFADGRLVLSGPGLYVNRALAVGLVGDVVESDLDELEARSSVVGVRPAIEIGELTRPGVRRVVTNRGYRPGPPTSALMRALTDLPPVPSKVEVASISAHDLPLWREIAARGWGHSTDAARRANDAFAAAAAVVDGPGMVLARAAEDGRPLGCASLTIRDGVATLGGMSTLPTERRRGVQGALIAHRLAMALRYGCEFAVSSALAGGDSERNLERHGFTRLHTKQVFEL